MLGCYDFNGHYDWTFEWFRKLGGETLVKRYWVEAIALDSQRHAAALIMAEGFVGMKKYWEPTLEEEGGEHSMHMGSDHYRSDMLDCPSLGFLMRNNIRFYHDYCEHCAGWVHPIMEAAGFITYSEHDHCGHCRWEFRRKGDPTPALTDTPNLPGWNADTVHRFEKS